MATSSMDDGEAVNQPAAGKARWRFAGDDEAPLTGKLDRDMWHISHAGLFTLLFGQSKSELAWGSAGKSRHNQLQALFSRSKDLLTRDVQEHVGFQALCAYRWDCALTYGHRHRLWLPRFDVTTGEGRAEPTASLPSSLHLVAYKSSVFKSAGNGRLYRCRQVARDCTELGHIAPCLYIPRYYNTHVDGIDNHDAAYCYK
ncbi:uncharacterized protein TrAtP1_005993 [Trichoderma atroviride]|uniref:uncharacterized protein n=1 Tax=Hypocrea atroviridis TaxID=63577 RepID=UPI00332550C4|nr:hypothetical protein TrAtP1_005993 [Trichoderma atroviride]